MSQPDTAAAAIADQLATFIQDSLLLGKPTDVRGLTSFLEAGIIDSTGVLELVQFIEETEPGRDEGEESSTG